MSTENKVQEFVHQLEEGGWAKWVRWGLLAAALLYILSAWMFKESGFRGLSHEKAMDQAQIARELARGNGFSTKMIRPAAIWQFQSNRNQFPVGNIPDTFHAPLNPFLNSLLLRFTEGKWTLTESDVVYVNDRVIATAQTLFFLLAILVAYFSALRLFDQRLAVLGCGLLLMGEIFWDFSMSGLPQMLMLFLLSCATWVLVRLLEARQASRPTLLWSAALGLLFGLLGLAHALTLFIFAGALTCALLFLRPLGRDAAIMGAACLLLFAPWLVRNHLVCGNPLGLGWYSGLVGVRGTESVVMRSIALEGPLEGVTPRIFTFKVRTQIIEQLGALFQYLGLVAPAFFIALLHPFRKPETALFRWWIFVMWLFALFGMAIFGLEPRQPFLNPAPVKANDLHILFVPLMTFYGLAFILVLWSRLEIHLPLARTAFLGGIYLISGLPFLSQLIDLHRAQPSKIHWPPYVPPSISTLTDWTQPNEIILSDMPWAVAWYADRKSLWLPITLPEFATIYDYNQLGNPIVGLYLTPVSSYRPMMKEIFSGEYQAWASFIFHQASPAGFPFQAAVPMAMSQECIFYADRVRWNLR